MGESKGGRKEESRKGGRKEGKGEGNKDGFKEEWKAERRNPMSISVDMKKLLSDSRQRRNEPNRGCLRTFKTSFLSEKYEIDTVDWKTVGSPSIMTQQI